MIKLNKNSTIQEANESPQNDNTASQQHATATRPDVVDAKVYKLKTELYDGTLNEKSEDYHDGAHKAYNTILDIINEYGN